MTKIDPSDVENVMQMNAAVGGVTALEKTEEKITGANTAVAVATVALADADYRLDDNLLRTGGQVFLTGTQALIRLLMMQKALDRKNGVNTAGFLSGYRGSPLGAVDQEAWRAARHLQEAGIEFLPAINE